MTLELTCDVRQKLHTCSRCTGTSCMGQRCVLLIGSTRYSPAALPVSWALGNIYLVAPLILSRSKCRPREVHRLSRSLSFLRAELGINLRSSDFFFFNHVSLSYNLPALIFPIIEKVKWYLWISKMICWLWEESWLNVITKNVFITRPGHPSRHGRIQTRYSRLSWARQGRCCLRPWTVWSWASISTLMI